MNNPIIRVENLTKRFGNFTAVDHISFDVKKGEIFGFLGPNGAGKSTTIRMLTMLTEPTEGTIEIDGTNINNTNINDIKQKVGLVAEKLIMYDYLTASENLLFFGRLYNIEEKILKSRIEELLRDIKMWEWKDHQIGTFSSGMKQRINIIRALITDPEIILMDEPTLGLDPQSTRYVREFILELNKRGKTVILTTHIMTEAELVCHRIGIIDHGKIVALDTSKNLKKMVTPNGSHQVELELSRLPGNLLNKIKNRPLVKNVDLLDSNHIKIFLNNENCLGDIIDLIREQKINILKLQTYSPTLEDVFISLTGRELRDKKEKFKKQNRRSFIRAHKRGR